MAGAENLYALSRAKPSSQGSAELPARMDNPNIMPCSRLEPYPCSDDDSESAAGQNASISSPCAGLMEVPSSSSSFSPSESEKRTGSTYESEAASQDFPIDSPSPSSYFIGQDASTDDKVRVMNGVGTTRTRRREQVNHLPPALPNPRRSAKKQIQMWQDWEKTYVQNVVKEVCGEDNSASRTELRWELFSDRLAAKYSINRSASSIKNYWNREGRAASGYDERNKKDPHHMITGVQDKEKRKAARRGRGQGEPIYSFTPLLG